MAANPWVESKTNVYQPYKPVTVQCVYRPYKPVKACEGCKDKAACAEVTWYPELGVAL